MTAAHDEPGRIQSQARTRGCALEMLDESSFSGAVWTPASWILKHPALMSHEICMSRVALIAEAGDTYTSHGCVTLSSPVLSPSDWDCSGTGPGCPPLPTEEGMLLGRCALRVQSHAPGSRTDGGRRMNGGVATGIARPRLPGLPIVSWAGRPGAVLHCWSAIRPQRVWFPGSPWQSMARGPDTAPGSRRRGSRIQQPSVGSLRRPGLLVAPRVVIRCPSSFPVVHVSVFLSRQNRSSPSMANALPPHHEARPKPAANTRPWLARPRRR